METLRIVIGVYVAVLLALIFMVNSISRHKKRFEVIFTYDVDFVFYEMAKHILDAKDELYDYDNALEILYHDKKRIFTKPVLAYQEQFPKIRENMEYLEKLLQKDIFSDKFRKRLTQNYHTLQRISATSRTTHTILTFRTL